MSQGWNTTWRVLRRSVNEGADAILLESLEGPHPSIRQRALETLLDRRSDVGPRQLLQNWHLLCQETKEIIARRSGKLLGVLREAVLDTNPQLVANGCEAALRTVEYDLIPTLVVAAEDHVNQHADLAAGTVVQLSQLLENERTVPNKPASHRNLRSICQRVTPCLEQSMQRFTEHQRPELVAAFLLLTRRDNSTFKNIIGDPQHAAYSNCVNTLTSSVLPGIMRFLAGTLDESRAPSNLLDILGQRTDLDFLEHLLENFGSAPSKTTLANLLRVERLAWADDDYQVVDQLADMFHPAALQMVVNSGVSRDTAFAFTRHFLQHGTGPARRSAANLLAHFDGTVANRLALEALEDPDPEVQAHAVRQIRPRKYPDALSLLVKAIDSPYDIVRGAARDSLPEFRFEKYLASFDSLDDSMRQSTGWLVKLADPQSCDFLAEELGAPVRSRRLRGLRIIQTMELSETMETPVIAALLDDDHMVRVEAARTLNGCNTRRSREALHAALSDRSVAVQGVARQSLASHKEQHNTVPQT